MVADRLRQYQRPILLVIACLSAGLIIRHTSRRVIPWDYVKARYATIDSLVHRGTYAIDEGMFSETIDKARIDGHFYSSKLPLQPTVLAGIYYLMTKITGYTLANDPGFIAFTLNLITGLGSHLLILYLFYLLLNLMVSRPTAKIAAFACVAFAYLGVTYATEMQNHVPAAAATLAAFYLALTVRHDEAVGRWRWVVCGTVSALPYTLDLSASLTTPAIFGYLLANDWMRTLKLWLPGTLPTIAVNSLVMVIATGSIVPVQLRKGVMRYPGSYWENPGPLDSLKEPKHVYAFHTLLGHHGVFAMTPVFFLALVAFARVIRGKGAWYREALFVVLLFATSCSYLILRTGNYGGACVGFRWLIWCMPLLLLFVGQWADAVPASIENIVLFAAFFALSSWHALDALGRPLTLSKWHFLVQCGLRAIAR